MTAPTVVGPVGAGPRDPGALGVVGDGESVAPRVPDAVDRLASAVSAFRAEQDAVAARQLAMPDLALDRIRGRVRSALEPVIAMFDAQAADVEAEARKGAGDRRLTDRAVDSERARIRGAREENVKELVEPIEQELEQAEQKVQAQIAHFSEVATDEDRSAVADLGYAVLNLMPNHGAPELTRFLRAAVEAKDVGRVSALLPLLSSLADRFPHAPGLDVLIVQANAAAASWQQQVTQGRLARIQRLRWALRQVASRVARYDPETPARWFDFEAADPFEVADPKAPKHAPPPVVPAHKPRWLRELERKEASK